MIVREGRTGQGGNFRREREASAVLFFGGDTYGRAEFS